MCIMLTRKWTCYSWVDFCVFLDRETVGLPDLCWIWILPEHWFTQPAVRWLPSCVSTPNMASKAHTFNCIFSCHSYWGFFFFFPSRYFLKQCTNFYNISAEQVAEAVTQTNEYYGAYDIRSSRIVFPNGSIDPWHALGVTQDISADLPAIFIKGEQKWCIMNFYVKFVLHSGYTFVGRMSVSNHEISICPNNPC